MRLFKWIKSLFIRPKCKHKFKKPPFYALDGSTYAKCIHCGLKINLAPGENVKEEFRA